MGKKAVKRAPMESSPPSSSYPVGEEAKALFRHQTLLQDYEVLVKETEAKRQKKLEMSQRKLRLLAEVKFLRRKLKSFSEKSSAKTLARLKKQSNKKIAPPVRYAHVEKPVLQEQSYQEDRSYKVAKTAAPRTTDFLDLNQEDRTYKVAKTAVPRTTAWLDLNQLSGPDVEDLEQQEQDPPRMDNLNRSLVGSTMTNDIKLSLHREFSSETNQMGRRKISWQDPVPLRV